MFNNNDGRNTLQFVRDVSPEWIPRADVEDDWYTSAVQVIRPPERSFVSITKPKISCPSIFRNMHLEKDPSDVFRKPTIVAFWSLPKPTIIDIDADLEYSKFYGKFKNNIDNVIKVDLSNQTEFAVIGPTGCAKYENLREKMINCQLVENASRQQLKNFLTEDELVSYWKKTSADHIAAIEKFESFNYATQNFGYPKATFLCSSESMVLVAEKLNNQPGEISALIQKDYNENENNKESFKFTTSEAKFYIEMKNDGQCDFVKNENNSEKEEVTGYNDISHYTESVEIELRYDGRQTNLPKAKVRLMNRDDIEKAIKVFKDHWIEAHEITGARHPTLIIKSLPKRVSHQEYLNWWLKKILSAGNIEFKLAYFCVAQVTPVRPNYGWNKSNLSKPEHLFAKTLVGLASDEWFLPHDGLENWEALSKQQFDIVEHRIPNKAQETHLVARYSGKNVELGLKVANGCEHRHEHSFMRVTNTKFFPANIHLKFKKMRPMSRKVRIALDSVIKNLDDRMREYHVLFEENDPETFKNERMENHSVRVVDEWSNDEEDGYIGIEGWPKNLVEEQLENLNTILKPLEFAITPEYEPLLYGVGEMFLKHLISNAGPDIVVDVDRFNSKITVFGEYAQEFIDKLREFGVPNIMDVKVEIPLNPPFNNNIKKLFTATLCEEIKFEWGADINVDEMKNMVMFVGPLEAFKVFWKILNDINREIFKKLASHLPKSVTDPLCPICMCEIDPKHYRLESCGHVYCRDCLNRMIRSSFEAPEILPNCSYEGCDKKICPKDLKEIIVGGVDRIKVLDGNKLKVMFEKTINRVILQSGEKYHPCKTADCMGYLQPTGIKGQAITCLVCQKDFCAVCANITHLDIESCEQFEEIQRNSELSLQTYISRMGPIKVRKCPKCSVMIEKNEGCYHMFCSLCNSNFCWICGHQEQYGFSIYNHISLLHREEEQALLDQMRIEEFEMNRPFF